MASVFNQINGYSNEAVMWIMKQVEGSILTPLLAPTYAGDGRQQERLEKAKTGLLAASFFLSISCFAISVQSFERQNSHFALVALGVLASTLCRSCATYITSAMQDDAQQRVSKSEKIVGGSYLLCTGWSPVCSMTDPWNPAPTSVKQWMALIATMIAVVKLGQIGTKYMAGKGFFAKIEWANTRPSSNLISFRESAHVAVGNGIRCGREWLTLSEIQKVQNHL